MGKGEPPRGLKIEANLGFFEDEHGVQVQVETVFVLAVHYRFEKFEDMDRTEADTADIDNLKKTFAENRKCEFREISYNRERLFSLLKNEEELLNLFDSDAPPAVFFLFVLSHGGCNGVIFINKTDSEKLEECKTSDIFDCLKEVKGFSACQKFVFFGPCRGLQDDLIHREFQEIDNRDSCTVSFFPNMNNLVVVYATVEKFTSQKNCTGTSLVRNVCRELNAMQENQTIAHFLTAIKNNVQSDAPLQGEFNQTPESKIFLHSRKFFFTPLPEILRRVENGPDGKGSIENLKSRLDGFYFPWKSNDGFLYKPRHAAILYSDPKNKDVARLELALKDNLGFNTNVQELNTSSFNRCCENNLSRHYECMATFFFTKIAEPAENDEVCIMVDNKKMPVGAVIHSFLGPKNDKWIGKPKLIFVVDQASSSDGSGLHQEMESVSATNNSGWLFFYIRSDDLTSFFEVFENKDLQRKPKKIGPSLQDLLGNLLIGPQTEGTRIMMVSTLQYLLAFPRRNFVHFDVNLTSESLGYEHKHMNFKELVDLASQIENRHLLWLISAPPGSGKTMVLEETIYELQAKLDGYEVIKITRQNVNRYILDTDLADLELAKVLATAADFTENHIKRLLEEGKIVLVFDGFEEIFLNTIKQREKGLKIVDGAVARKIPMWICTWPGDERTIAARFEAARQVVVNINPLDRDLQVKILKFYQPEASDEHIDQFLINLEQIGCSDILENPLHLKLLARPEIINTEVANVRNIYETLISHKVKEGLVRMERHDDNAPGSKMVKKRRNKELQKFAFDYLNDSLNLRNYKVNRAVTNTGIATIEDGQVKFISESIATFLAAEHLRNMPDKETLQQFIDKPNFQHMRVFFNSVISTKRQIKNSMLLLEQT
ncbi:uncharacterized protein LOC132197483 isoform X2 [Neocloeon triangulifer]|uniref:uncharacterized protein LOC132197483 isoform X2 n=1 Tax=Neocloeon triangulifer TaxID=2078957 RepID=UPI00286F1A7E|nr:uncharacterized protein LOC132197483 isoform X2 [Neocloeon triangulifer]